jgi:hypothetical protein
VAFFFVLTVVATSAAVAANSARNGQTPSIIAATKPAVTVGPGAPEGTVRQTTAAATLPTAPAPTITTGPLPAAPGAPSTGAVTTPPPPPTPNPNALAVWPAGQSGYTDVLESIRTGDGRAAAAAHARQARQAGLKDVGVLVSSQYSSLHPRCMRRASGAPTRCASPADRAANRSQQRQRIGPLCNTACNV